MNQSDNWWRCLDRKCSPRRPHRGLTFITVLILLAISGGVYWLVAFAEVYWDNQEVKSVLVQGANLAYAEPDDAKVRVFIHRKLHEMFDTEVEERGRKTKGMKIELDPEDLRIERTKVPAYVHIWLTYQRSVKMPLTSQVRSITFIDHAEQDLSPVKW
jgi:hypothetical protein